MDKNDWYSGGIRTKKFFGFVVDKEGNIYNMPSCYELQEDNC